MRTFRARLLNCSIRQLAAAFFYCYDVSNDVEFLAAEEPLLTEAFFPPPAAGFRLDWRFLAEDEWAGDYSAIPPAILAAWKLIVSLFSSCSKVGLIPSLPATGFSLFSGLAFRL